MYTFAIGLLLVTFQVSFDSAPGRLRLKPAAHTDFSEGKPADVSQEKPPDSSKDTTHTTVTTDTTMQIL